jgi:hypothetical protein
VIERGPSYLGDRIAVADLKLPRDIGTSQHQFAVQVTTIHNLVVGDSEQPSATDGGGSRERVSADDVDGDDALIGQGGQPSSSGERRQGSLGSVEANHDG